MQTRFIKEPFSDICLIFEKGKIISATASSNEEVLNEILDSDEGADMLENLL